MDHQRVACESSRLHRLRNMAMGALATARKRQRHIHFSRIAHALVSVTYQVTAGKLTAIIAAVTTVAPTVNTWSASLELVSATLSAIRQATPQRTAATDVAGTFSSCV